MNAIFDFMIQYHFEFFCLLIGIILFFYWIVSIEKKAKNQEEVKQKLKGSSEKNFWTRICILSKKKRKWLLCFSVFLMAFSTAIVIYKSVVKPDYSEWVSIVITVALSGFAVYIGIRMNKKTNESLLQIKEHQKIIKNYQSQISDNLENIKNVEKNLVDITRKPLKSINEILYECFNLTSKAKKGHPRKIWMLSFTLGFGPAHDIPEIEESWNESYKSIFAADYTTFNREIIEVIKKSSEKTIVCLESDDKTINSKFVNPLYQKEPYLKYSRLIDSKVNEINKLHKKVVKDSEVTPKVISVIPLQAIIIEYQNGADTKLSGVVFHVGTENVKSDRVQGFYTEIPNMCNIFIDLIKSLNESIEKSKN